MKTLLSHLCYPGQWSSKIKDLQKFLVLKSVTEQFFMKYLKLGLNVKNFYCLWGLKAMKSLFVSLIFMISTGKYNDGWMDTGLNCGDLGVRCQPQSKPIKLKLTSIISSTL